jgi:uncharacterized protein YunC (DUF1805 family)
VINVSTITLRGGSCEACKRDLQKGKLGLLVVQDDSLTLLCDRCGGFVEDIIGSVMKHISGFFVRQSVYGKVGEK